MVRSDVENDWPYIAADGDYAVEVVVESRHQEQLEWLAGGLPEAPAEYTFMALLTCELDNPSVPGAVSVTIEGVRVGYLPADAAARFLAAMDVGDDYGAVCQAIIGGGWYRSADDKGDFWVRLDADPDFTMIWPAVALEAESPRNVRSSAVLTDDPPIEAATAGVTGKSRGAAWALGAGATLLVAALAGGVWLKVQKSKGSGTTSVAAAAPHDAGITTVTSGQTLPALTVSAPGLSAVRPSDVTTVAPEPLIAPAPRSTRALSLAAGGAVADGSPRARTGAPHRAQSIAVVAAAGKPVAAQEVLAAQDRGPSFAALAAPPALEIGPPVAIATTVFALPPIPRPAPPAESGDLPSAGESASTAATDKRDARSVARERAKERAKARAEARARARARARNRNAARAHDIRRQRQIARQQDLPREGPRAAALPLPPAAQMFEALAKEWSKALEQPSPRR